MTPEEKIRIAIHCLGFQAEQEVCEECPVYDEGRIACTEVARSALKALKEIQQYRSMDERLSEVYGENNGLLKTLVEYILKWKSENKAGEIPAKTIMLTDEDVDRWNAYKEIGTVEECREAVEKQKPKDVVKFSEIIETIFREIERTALFCPECGSYICEEKDDMPKHCNNCGQAINRSNEN